jgi:hypothetical protein
MDLHIVHREDICYFAAMNKRCLFQNYKLEVIFHVLACFQMFINNRCSDLRCEHDIQKQKSWSK